VYALPIDVHFTCQLGTMMKVICLAACSLFIGYLKSRASLNKGLLALNRSSVLVIEARCAAKAKLAY
jgi:hypothetical protein